MQFLEHVPLAPYTTFRIGGPTRWFAEAHTEADILEGVRFADEHALALFVLGGGSNVLVSDKGFPGLALHIASSGLEQRDLPNGKVSFDLAAGEGWDSFVTQAAKAECGGIECLAGIPGTTGATPIQNVGAYGQEVAQTIQEVRALDRHSLQFIDIPGTACHFSYRQSLFNTSMRERYIITRVSFRLSKGLPGSVTYPDLRRFFAGAFEPPTPLEVAEAVRAIRRTKGMVIVEGDPDSRSAGSFFKNPILPAEQLGAIAEKAGIAEDQVPRFPADQGCMKIPAAWLLEHAGFHKGYRRGGAAISSRHTLALTNYSNASAQEIVALRDEVVAQVRNHFNITLEAEPLLIGFENADVQTSNPVFARTAK